MALGRRGVKLGAHVDREAPARGLHPREATDAGEVEPAAAGTDSQQAGDRHEVRVERRAEALELETLEVRRGTRA